MAAVRSGQLTPMFFGSAMSNFGVQLFLETFIGLASPPGGGPVLIKYCVGFCCSQAGQRVGHEYCLSTFCIPCNLHGGQGFAEPYA